MLVSTVQFLFMLSEIRGFHCCDKCVLSLFVIFGNACIISNSINNILFLMFLCSFFTVQNSYHSPFFRFWFMLSFLPTVCIIPVCYFRNAYIFSNSINTISFRFCLCLQKYPQHFFQ